MRMSTPWRICSFDSILAFSFEASSWIPQLIAFMLPSRVARMRSIYDSNDTIREVKYAYLIMHSLSWPPKRKFLNQVHWGVSSASASIDGRATLASAASSLSSGQMKTSFLAHSRFFDSTLSCDSDRHVFVIMVHYWAD